MPTDLTYLSEPYLMYCIVPLWLAVGVARWVMPRRAGIGHISGPTESMVHRFLTLLPLLALSLLVLLHWPQFMALLGIGPEVADFNLSLKASPLPRHAVLWLLGAIVMFELLPYGEALLRTVRGNQLPRTLA